MSSSGRIRSTAVAALVFVLVCFLPVQARDCYSCTGENCVRATSAGIVTTCTNSNDLCFTRYDATSLLPTERGCLPVASASTCAGNECVTCSTDDLCNELSSPSHRCAVCTSLVDPNCLGNPSSLADVQCPATSAVDLTSAQCYSRVVGTVTERGCITSQGDVDRCTGLDCATCTGSGCNREEFPTGRIQCIRCDNPDSCDSDATSLVYCDDLDDVCVTMRRANGNVMKSCEKAMSVDDAAYCSSNRSHCTLCGKSLCNAVTFNQGSGDKSCFQCEGNACLMSSVRLVTCRLSDDECFSTFSGFNPSGRGCASDLTREQRASCTGPECITCSESECNLLSREDHKCVYCSTTVDGSCVAPVATEVVQCAAPSTDVTDAQCYTKIVDDIITERGCISTASDLQGCTADGRNCATCSIESNGEGCNDGIFPSNRRRCTIDTAANAYCPNPWDDCVQLLRDGTRKRTCRSSLSPIEQTYCNTNSNRCRFCSTDNCNAAEVNFNYVECLSCDSTTDERCATNPDALNTFETCTNCATAIITNSDGKTSTRRGCLASLPSNVSSQCSVVAGSGNTCQRCSTNRCNVANFPVDRLQCYRCVDPPCISHQSVRLEYCPEYRSNDSCLLQMDASGQLLRLDCRSSLSAAELSTCSGLCQTCSTSSCNDPMTHVTSGSCVQCRSTLNPLCRGQATEIQPEPCANPINAVCYSRLTNGTTERGCLTDLAASEQSACTRGENCLVCGSRTTNCNTVQYPVAPLTCFQCDSRTDGQSCKDLQTGTATECPNYDSANKCYTIVQSNGDTVRKCSTQPREVECGSIGTCEVCLFRGCNSKDSLSIVVTEPPVLTTTPGPKNRAVPLVGSIAPLFVMLLHFWSH